MKNLEKLYTALQGLADGLSELEEDSLPLDHTLKPLYEKMNGFIAFESALIGFPIGTGSIVDALNFNQGKWKNNYNKNVQNTFFFATDAFGFPYGVLDGSIVKLNSESGVLERHSENLDKWAEKIIEDYDYETGWSLCRDWQLHKNKRLAVNERLIPKKPFSMGGEFEITNLISMNILEVMENYSKLYLQVKDAKKGQTITIQNWLGK